MKKVVQPFSSLRPERRSSEQKPRLLYVEDDEENWQVAELRLNQDFDLLRAENSREACRLLKTRCDDLIAILMDIELRGSELNGIELTELFRGKRSGRVLPDYARGLPTFTSPIIFVTAHGARYSEVELMLFGADRAIPKPVNFAALTSALHSIQFERGTRRK